MRFLFPSLFVAWSLLLLVPIALYLFRPRPKTVRTSTLPFFKWLAREHQESAWLRRLKHLLSLLLSILIILAAAAALGRLVIARSPGSFHTVVILVDRSASMAARAGDGPSRLEEAISIVRQRLAGLPAAAGVVVIAYDRRPEVLLSRSLDRRQVQRALDSIDVRPIEADAAQAMQLAQRLAALETPACVWHATDVFREQSASADPDATSESPETSTAEDKETSETDEKLDQPVQPTDVQVEPLNVALARPVNVGITAFQIRRRPLERTGLEAIVQVHCAAPEGETIEASLDIELDAALVAPRKLTLPAGGRQRLLVPIDAQPGADRVLTMRVSAEGDVLDVDNVVHARVPPLKPARVLWISESPDPFTELALASLGVDGDLDVLQGSPSTWPPEEPVDVVIFDNWLPAQWPPDAAVIVINPPGSLGPLQAVRIRGDGVPIENVRTISDGHPVLYGVASGRVALTQTAIIETGGLLDSVWVGSQGPVLQAGEVRGQRVVVMGFSPQRSQRLPFLASCPLLIGNAIYWAAESDLESSLGMNRRTGEIVPLEGSTLIWEPVDADDQAETSVKLEGHSAELDRIGLWRSDDGQLGSASLLSVADTVIPAQPEGNEAGVDVKTAGSLFRGDLLPFLLWGLLSLFMIESWLFHRYIAY